jgi:hypothetical protein
METLATIRWAFGKESVSRTREFEWHARFRADRKKARQMKSKVKSMLIIFYHIKEIVHKAHWQAKRSIVHITDI